MNPARDWSISAALLVLGIVVGASCLPHRLTDGPSALRFFDPRRGDSGIAGAVFALRDDGMPIRFGNADMTPDGTIRVGFYDPLDPLQANATEAVTLPADARLLWLLAAPSERQAIRERAGAFIVALSGDVRQILQSPEFVADYRDRLLDIMRTVMMESWQATQDSGAWRSLLNSYEPLARELANRDLKPIVERHFRAVPGRVLRANALILLDPFNSRPWDLEPVEQAFRAALTELRDKQVPEHIVSRLMESPQTTRFLRVFQDELVRRLAHDTALHSLIAEMIYDERFRPYVADALDRANDLGRYAPRLLVSLRGTRELNLVAATVIRTTISGRPDRVVVFMNPAQRDEIAALDRPAIHLLEPAGRP